MWWTREGSYEKRPTADRVRMLVPIAAVVALLLATDPLGLVGALIPRGETDLAEYGRALPAYTPFTRSLLTSVAPFLAGAVLLALAATRYASRAQVAARAIDARPVDDLLTGERGVSAIEFMLLLPLLLVIMLTILQMTLIIQAKFVVNYAAFCAVRSAVVTIPGTVDGGDEAKNQIKHDDSDSKKMQMIRRAAQFPCTAISPRLTADNILSLSESTGLGLTVPDPSFLLQLGKVALFTPASSPGPEVLAQFFTRVPYAFADANTTIELSGGSGSGPMTFGVETPVTVKVTHRYFLAVPFASRLFGTKYFDDGGGIFGIRSGYYVNITERYTLPNEGQRLAPEGTEIE